MRLSFAIALLMALPVHADEVSDSRKLQTAALEAYRQKDAPLFLEKIAAASALRPHHLGLLYQLAVAQAMNGRAGDAVATLRRIAQMGFVFVPSKDPKLASLAGTAGYDEVVAAFARNELPVGKPSVAFTLKEPGQIIEGLARDPSSGRLFVSSVRTKRIFALLPTGEAKVFAAGLPWGAFGLAVDRRRNVLWAATSGVPQTEGFTEADRGKAGLAKIDLRTGSVLAILKPDDAGPHLFGDVTVAPNGDVFTTDSSAPAIYRVRGDRLERFADGPFASLQGVAAARNGRLLYVADYAKGLYAVDVATRDVYKLPVPDSTSFLGIDGIYTAGPNELIATQNGMRPNRVLRISLAEDGLRVVSYEVLAANDPHMTDVTLGVIHGKRFYFVANAQWDAFDEQGAPKPTAKPERVTILAVPCR